MPVTQYIKDQTFYNRITKYRLMDILQIINERKNLLKLAHYINGDKIEEKKMYIFQSELQGVKTFSSDPDMQNGYVIEYNKDSLSTKIEKRDGKTTI